MSSLEPPLNHLHKKSSRTPSPALSRITSTASSAPSLHRSASPLPLLPRSSSYSRLSLRYQAQGWRFLEQIGSYLNNWPHPVPPEPAFIHHYHTSDDPPASLELAFYVPKDYTRRIAEGYRYPVVANFHGGGFTLGTTRDDARWAAYILQETPAICVSVEYRLAPEHPFPTAVEDGVEALLHLAAHSSSYGIDPTKTALSGFSAGGNLSFAVPLRLASYISSLPPSQTDEQPRPQIKAIISWYPALDMRISRATRRATSPRPDKTLPDILTGLFDSSYLPDDASKTSPYASPSAATDEQLVSALPDRIAFYLCEWDMLLREGKDFAERLRGLGKEVDVTIIKETRHAFDKAPCPFGVDPKVGAHYSAACAVIADVFDEGGEVQS